MKSFFKNLFSSCLGVIAGLGCFTFILIFSFSAFLASAFTADDPIPVDDNTILKIDVASIDEFVVEDFSQIIDGVNKETYAPVSLTEAIQSIKKAKNNPNISGIYLNLDNFAGGMAATEELRRALEDFKKSDKFIIAYGDSYSQKSYYLSTVADKLILNPSGMLALVGISSNTVLFKNALDKLGVKMEVFKVGTYKAAVEPYIKEHISPENEEQISAYIGGLWQHILDVVSKSRNISSEQLNDYVNSGIAFEDTKRFVELGLVDMLAYRSDVRAIVAEAAGVAEDELHMVGLAEMTRVADTEPVENDKVQVIIAEGEIKDVETNSNFSKSSEITYSLVDQLNEAMEREDTKAVVLRVNSPGGSAFMSEQIWYAVKKLAEKKKVVISMGNLAASGGYYISSAGDYIFAEETTLTGSIGIFGLIPNAEELAHKLGVNVDVVKTNKYASMNLGLPIKSMSEEEKALIQRHVERGYDLFLSRVSEGRKISKEEVDKIGQGRVWLGVKALEIGLVDELGGLDNAIAKAAELAGLGLYSVEYPKTRLSLMDNFNMKMLSNSFVASIEEQFLSEEEAKVLNFLKEHKHYMGLQARMPYSISAY